MTQPRALDLFCGAGGASMGLHRAGFDVTGVDIKQQKRYPFRFIQGDALRPPVRLEDFDLIWASPPCQGYSIMRNLPWLRGREYPMLIPAVREMLMASGAEFIGSVVVVEGNGARLRCTECGATTTLELPMPISTWVRRCRDFDRQHERCAGRRGAEDGTHG